MLSVLRLIGRKAFYQNLPLAVDAYLAKVDHAWRWHGSSRPEGKMLQTGPVMPWDHFESEITPSLV